MTAERFEQTPISNGLPSGMPPLMLGLERPAAIGASLGRGQPKREEAKVSPEEEAARSTVAELRPIDISFLTVKNEKGETVSDKDGITVLRKRGDLITELEAASDVSHEERERILSSYDRAMADVTYYTMFLAHSSNKQHFDNPPRKPADMLHRWNMPGRYPLVAVNKLGEVVGGITIADAEADQNDHWITKVVVDPKLQNRKVGFQLLFHAIDWAFSNPDMRGQQRKKLDMSVIMFVRGWERMWTVSRKLGFEPKMILPDQVRVRLSQKKEVVVDPDERREDNPTMRFEIEAYKWRLIKEDVYARMQREISALQERARLTPSK